MKRALTLMLVIGFLLGACSSRYGSNAIEVHDAWMRPAPQGSNGAVYFVIRSSQADEIVAVTAEVAEATEMHESKMNGDVMEMHQLQSVRLDAGEEVTFEPGGLHIMLVGLKQELKTGDEIEITLQFRKAQDIQLRVPVRDSPASGQNH